MDKSSREFYKLVKKDFKFEDYLKRLSLDKRIYITKLRTSNLKLPIETGRWSNIPKENRICTFCYEHIGDEFHTLFTCKNQDISLLRRKFIPRYYWDPARTHKMIGLFSLCNTQLLTNVSVFIKKMNMLL